MLLGVIFEHFTPFPFNVIIKKFVFKKIYDEAILKVFIKMRDILNRRFSSDQHKKIKVCV